MKSKIIIVCSVVVSIISIVLFSLFYNESSDNNIISNINKDKQIINSNMITMMYETESGSGEYTETKDNTWPESGYIFNENLSGCENGGELEYNSGNNTLNLLSNSSDQCYVYFDKYDGVWIDNVVTTNVTGSSITLDVSATSENGDIEFYYYSLNDSDEYVEVTTDPIVIDDLNKLTEYNIKIYALDNTGAQSNIYEINVSTTDISVPIINSVSVSNITSTGFTLIVDATSDVEIKRYYYIIENENISGTSTINSYTFNSLNAETNYNISIFIENTNGAYSNKYNLNIITKASGVNFHTYIKNLYTSQGANGIYYHSSSLANSANDGSYRYSGANPNNYVCFGTDSSSCSSDNLYRIIGVFNNEVKLIKSTKYGNYAWTLDETNNWDISNVNTILNNNYLNNLGTKWKNMISTHEWQIAEIGQPMRSDVVNYYNLEFGSTLQLNSTRIGLLYVSDYGYATLPAYWEDDMNGSYDYRDGIANNWLFIEENEWTIRPTTTANWIYAIYESGTVGGFGDGLSLGSNTNAVRPVFYLNSDVTYVSGDGSQENPYRIE